MCIRDRLPAEPLLLRVAHRLQSGAAIIAHDLHDARRRRGFRDGETFDIAANDLDAFHGQAIEFIGMVATGLALDRGERGRIDRTDEADIATRGTPGDALSLQQ